MSLPRPLEVLLAVMIVVAQSSGAAAQAPRPKAGAAPAKAATQVKPGMPPAAVTPGAKDAAAPPPPPEPPPPYEPKLLRLGEILGTLTYLRDLCGAGDGAEWRQRMSALIDAEGSTQQRKERLAGAFNRGFRGYQLTYHACTAAAQTIIERLLDEGDRITRDVASRYAG